MTARDEELGDFHWAAACAAAGIRDVKVLETRGGPHEAFGNRLATVRWGLLLLQFVRDRGQDLLDLAAAGEPSEWFDMEDLRQALGWATPPEAARVSDLLPLGVVLGELVHRRAELDEAFSASQLPETLATLRAVRQARRAAALARLQRRR